VTLQETQFECNLEINCETRKQFVKWPLLLNSFSFFFNNLTPTVWYVFHRPHFHVADNCGQIRAESSPNAFIAGVRLPAASDAR
jgi:hypothetical protein